MHKLNLEENSQHVQMGKILHAQKADDIHIESIVVDKLGKEYVTEIKKSDADVEAGKWQLMFYLKGLKDKGLERKGKLEFIEKKKQTKKVLVFELTKENEEMLAQYIEEIQKLVQSEDVPPIIHAKKCKKCAYYEYCYI